MCSTLTHRNIKWILSYLHASFSFIKRIVKISPNWKYSAVTIRFQTAMSVLRESKNFRTRAFGILPFCLVILHIQDPKQKSIVEYWTLLQFLLKGFYTHYPLSLPPAGSCLCDGSFCITAWSLEIDSTNDLMRDAIPVSLPPSAITTGRSHLILKPRKRELLSTHRWAQVRAPNLEFELMVWYLKTHNFLLALEPMN